MGAEVALREDELRSQLEKVRSHLDDVDARIIELIARRLALGIDAATIKRALNMPIRDPAREATVVEQAKGWARESGLDETEVAEIIRRLTALSRGAQEKLTDSEA